MRRIDRKEFKNYIEYAGQCSANQVYPLSVAAGTQSGEIYTDGNGSVLFWHYCGFAYISGTVSLRFLEKVYREFLCTDLERRFLLITDLAYAADFYASFDTLHIDKRIEYTLGNELIKKTEPDDYSIERITSDNIGSIKGRIIPSFSWDNSRNFLRDGFGFAARKEKRYAAAAFSSAVSSKEVDIGVETCENDRHKGLASYLSYRMCEEILKQGKRPVWAHAETNEGSQNTAVSLGFKPARVNTVIKRRSVMVR